MSTELRIAGVSFLYNNAAERILSMAKKRFFKRRSKYEDEAILVSSVITEIIEENAEYPNGKIKNVFKCKSSTDPEGRLCILWGRSCLEIGCAIDMKGRTVKNGDKDVFLAWSALVKKSRLGNEP